MSGSARKTILLVEDEAVIAMTEKVALEKFGYSVTAVTTGENAIEAVKKSSGIDLVLMDINLGNGIDGTIAAEIILKDRDLPIIFFSSHCEQEIVERTERITNYGYVAKNASLIVLDASIKMAFKLFDEKERFKALSNKLEATLDAIPGLMFIVDKNGYFKENHADHTSVKVAMDENKIVGGHLCDIFPPEEVALHLALYRICLETGNIQTKSYDLIIDGKKQYFNMQLAKLDESHILATIHDVTEQKMVEEALKASMETTNVMLNVAAEIIISKDFEGTITLLNDSGHTMLGYIPPELIGKNWFDMCVPEEIREDVRQYCMNLKNGAIDTVVTHENELITKTGKRKTIYWHNAVIKDKDGLPIGLLSSGEDITERKRSELALLETQERFRFALEGSGLGEWDWNLKTNKIRRNERWAEMLGYGLAEIGEDFQQGVELQHPDDRGRVKKAIQDHLAGRTDSFSVLFRMRTKNGTYKWIHDCGKIMERDEYGNPVRLCGTHADIDKHKQSEELIAKSKNLLSSILESSPDIIIFALDEEYRYLAFNWHSVTPNA